ncbi:hypothetical protein BTUL_0017g00520 [Botrytis tulipae]|uniref:Uncharacterized protein n=1 Tax=Botrytis tulipae TaxID=87230 RepID=A0A4Z1F7R3_9HELO|nr:hypothetical protein BTUL_0017g00520 [Botrytis tulipae]
MAQEQVLLFSFKACKPCSELIPDRALYLLGNVDNEQFLGSRDINGAVTICRLRMHLKDVQARQTNIFRGLETD